MLKTRSDMEVVHWARSIMEKHDLISQGWQFQIANWNSSTLGQCNPRKKLIQLSRDHILRDVYETILDTLLHEIAHALVGCHEGHNKIWQAKAMELGARPTSHKEREYMDFAEQPVNDVYAMFLNVDGKEQFYKLATKSLYIKVMSGQKDIKTMYYPADKARTLGNLSIRLVKSNDPLLNSN